MRLNDNLATPFETKLLKAAQHAISGSGNSPNVIEAVEWARENTVDIISFTGFDGGNLGRLSDINVHVPLKDMCQTEAVHSVLMHLIVDLLRARLAAQNIACWV